MKTRTAYLAAGLVGINLIAFAPVASSNLILNGSFEVPAIPANTSQSATPTSWFYTGSQGYLFNGNVAGWTSAADGEQFADFGNSPGSSLSQNFTLAAAGDYLLTWSDNAYPFPFDAATSYGVKVFDAASTVFANQYVAEDQDGAWNDRSVTLSFNAPGAYTIAFTPTGNTGYDAFLDKVALTAAVPVPAAVWLFGPGVALLTAAGRRLKRVA